MNCHACGAPIGESDKFCFRCGAPLLPLTRPPDPRQEQSSREPASSCPRCSHPVRSNDRFCGWCGTDVAAFRSPPPTAGDNQRRPPQLPLPSADTQPRSKAVLPGYLYLAIGLELALFAVLASEPELMDWWWWAQDRLKYAAVVWLAAGSPLTVLVLWRRGTPREKRHATVICALLLVTLVVTFMATLA